LPDVPYIQDTRAGGQSLRNKWTSTRRLLWLKVTLSLALLSGLLLSYKLWVLPRHYPLTPVWQGLPTVPPLASYVWFVGLLILLLVVGLVRRPRLWILSFVLLAGLLSLWDQSRWQPWFYQELFMLAALAIYPWATYDAEKIESALNACRLIVASTYLWSGLQKLNVGFFDGVFPWLSEPLVTLLPGLPEELLKSAAFVIPFFEAAIGIGLLTRVRNVAVIFALFMHAFILFSIGPLGHNWNSIVWPWNLAMMIFVILLFWRTNAFSIRNVLDPGSSPFRVVVLLLFALMPLFSFFGLWDSYLSASLYSGNTKDGILYVSESVKDELSGEVPDEALRSAESGPNVVDIFGWSMAELNVPPYPEVRVYKSVAEHVCTRADRPFEVSLVVTEKPPLFGESRKAEVYNCTGLKTDEHRTVKLG
jgi:hypothetical protein